MSTYPRTMPDAPRMFTAEVASRHRLSPSFQRVTLTGAELESFDHVGLDQWFRLFLPAADGRLRLPAVDGRSWWQAYLAIPEEERPHCSNYTVAGFRRGADGPELDIDVVLHHDAAGELCGAVAVWAASAAPGSPVGLLDQGVLFDPPADATELVLVADETGLPALRGIVRDLPATARGWVLVEVPHVGDVEDWDAPPGVDLTWLPRTDPGAAPGERALAALRASGRPAADAYAFVVGESSLATDGRRWLVDNGFAKDRIFFSGFWRR